MNSDDKTPPPPRQHLLSTDDLVGEHTDIPILPTNSQEDTTPPPTSSSIAPLPPPPRLTHATTERIPVLPSAPPSAANLSILPQAESFTVDSYESSGISSASSSFISTNTDVDSTSSPLTSSRGTSPAPPDNLAPLPPPPQMSALQPAKTTSTTSTTTSATLTAQPTRVTLPPLPPPRPITPQPQQEPPPPLQEPPKVRWPLSSSTETSILAPRHSSLNILVISTEHANTVAWKNGLRLTDLLQGLYHDVQTSASTRKQFPLPPFRSMQRSMLLSWEDLHLNFVTPSEFTQTDNALASAWLDEEAALVPSDGNLHQDLSILEDQIEVLLSDDPTTTTSKEHTNTSTVDAHSVESHDDEETTHTMDLYKSRQRRLEKVTQDAFRLTSPENIPWLARYKSTLNSTTDYLGHELCHAPLVVLLVCSSQEITSPVDCLRELSSRHYLPQDSFAAKSGLLDASQVQHVAWVLHDVQEGPRNFDETKLQPQLIRQFGNTKTAIVRLNSLSPNQEGLQESSDAWHGKGTLGRCLSASDRSILKRTLATLVTSTLLPAMERRIADLNTLVTDKKKGVKNVFKSLWRKPKEETSSTNNMNSASRSSNSQTHNYSKGAYRHDSIESQVRLLGDSLFLMRDWEAALSIYRLIKEDYKHDRALLHYASIQEMMGLASYMVDPHGRAREVFTYLENALYSYTQAAQEDRPTQMARPTEACVATRLATRLCLVLSSMAPHMDRPLEIADLLASASSHETPLGAAVLLEQSSAHYYQARMYRKYAFHMLMSGHMFRSAAQEHHAFRCFTSALYIYHDGRWEELHSHLQSALAAQLYSLGRMSVSMELYARLVGTDGGGRVSVKSQQKFVHHLLEICHQHGKKALVGADRMAAPQQEALRQERLARMEQVVRFTPHAKRVLELPNMDLPHLDESTVSLMVEAEVDEQTRVIPSLGTCGSRGEESIWEELMCSAAAEIKASDPHSVRVSQDELPAALAVVDHPLTRQVVALIDKEKSRRHAQARAKKAGHQKASPEVRARREPLVVEFSMSNPLGISIELTELQLVARLKASDSQRLCTSEDAILIQSPSSASAPPKTWSFKSSRHEYSVPDFCRIAPSAGDPGKTAWKSAEEEDPYFVVTKTNITLDPGSKVKVSLGICPRVMGDLEILGTRCKLFQDVWTYHPLNVKGPLLHNNSHNRANRVRAESMLLKAKVTEDMPRLTVHVVPGEHFSDGANKAESPALQGQISPWTLRISNIGTAAATAVSLKANMPWVKIAAPEESAQSATATDASPALHCIGPSGTLLSVPLKGTTLTTEGVIQPGETVDVPILVRMGGGGKQDFYMLFRYELWKAEGVSKQHRWLRKKIDVPVYPSLTFTASLMPSFWEKSEHIISVEITNYRTDQANEPAISLENMSLLSRNYHMQPVEGQLGDQDSGSPPNQLGWQERMTMHYRLIPLASTTSCCTITDCPFQADAKEEPAAATAAFLCLDRAHHDFQTALKKHQIELIRAAAAEEDGGHPRSIAQIRRAKSSVSESAHDSVHGIPADADDCEPQGVHPTSVASLCPSNDSKEKLNLVCSWTAPSEGGRIHGQHFVTHLPVRPSHNSKGCPLSITCKHPCSVAHDFSSGPLRIPFEITIRNRVLDQVVDFEFAMERPKASFDFIGAERFEWELDAGEELTVPAQAVISSPGVYNLQAVRIAVVKDASSVSYKFPLQWTVLVSSMS